MDAAVAREPDAVPVRGVVTRIRLPRTGPHHVRVRRGDGDRADRTDGVARPHVAPRQPAVGRLENAAAGGSEIIEVRDSRRCPPRRRCVRRRPPDRCCASSTRSNRSQMPSRRRARRRVHKREGLVLRLRRAPHASAQPFDYAPLRDASLRMTPRVASCACSGGRRRPAVLPRSSTDPARRHASSARSA